MKLLAVVIGLLLIAHSSLALPQLVGIATDGILNAINKLTNSASSAFYFEYEQPSQNAAAPPTGCDYPNYDAKFTQWTIDAGLSQITNYTSNGQALKDAINAVFAGINSTNNNNAQIALDKFCIAQRNFFQTLGVAQIGACIDVANFVGNGYDRNSAFQTQQVFVQLNYQCGAAFKSYTDYIQSYLSAQVSNKTDLDQCSTDFITNLDNATAVMQHGCPQLKVYEHCIGKVYNKATNNLDLAWTVCEAARRTNVISLPACRDSSWFCQLSQLSF